MVRLTNTLTGAVVTCSRETAARLGSEWVEVVEPKPIKKAAAKRSPKRN